MWYVSAMDLSGSPGPTTARSRGRAPAKPWTEQACARSLNQRWQTAKHCPCNHQVVGEAPQSHLLAPTLSPLALLEQSQYFFLLGEENAQAGAGRAAGRLWQDRVTPRCVLPRLLQTRRMGSAQCMPSALAKHVRRIDAAGIHSLKKSLKLNSYILIRYSALPKLVIKCLLFHAH